MSWNTILLNGETIYVKGIFNIVGNLPKPYSLSMITGYMISWSDEYQMYERQSFYNSKTQGVNLLANSPHALMD